MPKQFYYEGFSSPNGTVVPDDVFDLLAPQLTEAELRVLLYIIRRTFGFKKDRDAISLTQLVEGIKTKDGRVLDRGTGMSRRGVMRGCAGLIEKGIITAEKRLSDQGDNEVNIYSLRFRAEGGVGNDVPYGRELSALGVGNDVPPQQTVVQETVKQEMYPSNLRKAEKEKNEQQHQRSPFPSSSLQPLKQGRPKDDGDGGEEEKQKVSNHRKKSKQKETGELTADREETHRPQPKKTAAPGELLSQQFIPPPIPDDEAYEAIRDFIRDMAGKNHDEASLKSSTTRAYNLYQRAGVSLSYFFNLVYDADKEASRRSTTIKKRTADGFTNRMAYFFAVLEDKLGLREKLPPASP